MQRSTRKTLTATDVLERARALCNSLEATSRFVVPLALSLSAGLGGCAEECFSDADCAETQRCVGAENGYPDDAICILPATPSPGLCELELDQCRDGVDNDRDGKKDCFDDDCADSCAHSVAMYGAPFGV